MIILKATIARENLKSLDSATTQPLAESENIEGDSVIFLAPMIAMLFEFSAITHK